MSPSPFTSAALMGAEHLWRTRALQWRRDTPTAAAAARRIANTLLRRAVAVIDAERAATS